MLICATDSWPTISLQLQSLSPVRFSDHFWASACTATRYASSLESALQRIGDWIYYDGALYADAEVAAEEAIGLRRRRRMMVFNPARAELACRDLG